MKQYRKAITIKAQTLSKFRNIHCETGGKKFPSIREAVRYNDLLLLQSAREISELQTQVTFKIVVNGIFVCSYRADFVYKNKKGKIIIEDAKGFKTEIYKLKKKLLFATQGITILET